MSADPRPQPTAITLGSKTWTVRPLTLRQVEALEPLVARGSGESPFAYGLAVVSAALARDHDSDIAGLRDLEATSADLAEATRAVLILAGYLPGADPGEARAAQGAASTSTLSTDGFAPSPDGPSTSSAS
ncbi:hypothetical protein [Methylobacterium brachiatum]|jgi:hypothetical protein|uniref:hypothetical protein n=1 Tax=Methylobacterium brachiatum TaxID=269660 RepID=UPI000EFA43D8|nr:hypothetical protein [Methylobacterium brachiatum]AYO81582.1 hypothetical protein EBB05_04365 [Methylobacterium brachiatum]